MRGSGSKTDFAALQPRHGAEERAADLLDDGGLSVPWNTCGFIDVLKENTLAYTISKRLFLVSVQVILS
jgi:hypothetical protein